MKKLFCLVISGMFVSGLAMAKKKDTVKETNTVTETEKDVDVDGNILTGSETVTTTDTATKKTDGKKSKRMSKNVKKYDDKGNQIESIQEDSVNK